MKVSMRMESSDSYGTFEIAIYARKATINAENSTIKIDSYNSSDKTIYLDLTAGHTLNKVWVSGSQDIFVDLDSNGDTHTINELVIDAGRKFRFEAGANTQIKSLTAIGTASSGVTITSITNSPHTITNITGGTIDVTVGITRHRNNQQADRSRQVADGCQIHR